MINYVSLLAQLGVIGTVAGTEVRARCPLHSDKNPSFSMNIESGRWFCFSGCGGGNFLQLVEQVLNYNQMEAINWVNSNGKQNSIEELSRQLAIELGQVPGIAPVTVDDNWRRRYSSLSSRVIPQWFLARGFTWQTTLVWGIRYDPACDGIVIPVRWKGELVGTVTRQMIGQPKYQNSPNLPKSEILFGLSEISTRASTIIICEGILDAIYCQQNGLNAVALLGTYLSSKQVEIIKEHRFGDITLFLDNDEAGRKGTEEAVKSLSTVYLLPQINFINLPEGLKDANDCNPELLQEVYSNRKGMIYV